MSGKNNGTGHRLFARCFWCSRGRTSSRSRRGYSLAVTGERKYSPINSSASGRVDVFWRYQVRCVDCGRTSFTRHVDIARKWCHVTGEPFQESQR